MLKRIILSELEVSRAAVQFGPRKPLVEAAADCHGSLRRLLTKLLHGVAYYNYSSPADVAGGCFIAEVLHNKILVAT